MRSKNRAWFQAIAKTFGLIGHGSFPEGRVRRRTKGEVTTNATVTPSRGRQFHRLGPKNVISGVALVLSGVSAGSTWRPALPRWFSSPAEVVFVDFAEIQRVMFAGSHDRAVSRSFEGERSRFNVECQGVGAGVSAAGVRW